MDKVLNTDLAKLILENPELPILAMVYSDVVPDDSYSWWLGEPEACHTGAIITYDGRVFTDEDSEELLEIWADDNWDEIKDLTREEQDQRVETLGKEWLESLPWKRAIIVRIGTCEKV